MPDFYLSHAEFGARLEGFKLVAERIGFIRLYGICNICVLNVHCDRLLTVTVTPERPILSGPHANFAICIRLCDRCAGDGLLDEHLKQRLNEAMKSTDRGNP